MRLLIWIVYWWDQDQHHFFIEGDIIAQQDLDRFKGFCDLEQVDYEDAKTRLFAQSFSRDVKKWFRGLQARSICNFQEFEAIFLRKWEHARN